MPPSHRANILFLPHATSWIKKSLFPSLLTRDVVGPSTWIGCKAANLRCGLEEAGTTQQDDVWTRDTEDSWGILAESSTPEQDDIWNKGAVDSWGTLEEASPTQNDVAPKKDKEVGLEEEAGATQKDDKSKKDKGTPHVPVKPPVRHMKADEEAFNTSVAADRARQAANRKVQAQIDQNREQNAKGKGKPSTRSSKDGGRQHPPGKARYHTDTTLSGEISPITSRTG
ncbi:hypothetical protein JB92DRAFT_2910265 [Gautieria morchelliformis]|nr:hypothetical protein JB92DRAFT_2910265 [Gautieria morchelliformis]